MNQNGALIMKKFLLFFVIFHHLNLVYAISPVLKKSNVNAPIPLQMKIPYTGLSEIQTDSNLNEKIDSDQVYLNFQITNLSDLKLYDTVQSSYKPKYNYNNFSMVNFNLSSPVILYNSFLQLRIFGGLGYTSVSRTSILNYQNLDYENTTPIRFSMANFGLQADPQYLILKHLEPSLRFGPAYFIALAPTSIEQRGLEYKSTGWQYSLLLNKKFKSINFISKNLNFNLQFGVVGFKNFNESKKLSYRGMVLGIEI